MLTLAADLVTPASGALSGAGAMITGLCTFLAARSTFRRQHRAEKARPAREPYDLAAMLQAAAAAAIANVRSALEESEERYTEVRDELRLVRAELGATKQELHGSIESRDELRLELAARDLIIQDLRGEIDRLRTRVIELETRMSHAAQTTATIPTGGAGPSASG